MIVGVMQPYLFPYLGYYQLAYHCDKFVFYDDVNFITRGYINRNNVLSQGKALRFTVPVIKASQNTRINELYFSSDVRKILATMKHSYQKAPYFSDVFPFIESVLLNSKRNVAEITSQSITKVFDYLDISKKFYMSSQLDYNRDMDAADKLISICEKLKSTNYCNSLGGQVLYSKKYFLNKGVELNFINMGAVTYSQGKHDFINHLSIIDVLMWNSKADVIKLLSKYNLV